MINFYRVQEIYFRVEIKMITYGNDPRMQTLIFDLDKMTEVFATEVKKVSNGAKQFSTFL